MDLAIAMNERAASLGANQRRHGGGDGARVDRREAIEAPAEEEVGERADEDADSLADAAIGAARTAQEAGLDMSRRSNPISPSACSTRPLSAR